MNNENIDTILARLKNIESQAFETIYTAKQWAKEIEHESSAKKDASLIIEHISKKLWSIDHDLLEINKLIK